MTIKPFTRSPKLPPNPQRELQQQREKLKQLQMQEELLQQHVDADGGRATFRISVDLLSPNPKASRKVVNMEFLDRLTQSIAQHGLLQPITVRRHPDNPGTYQIVAGGLRWLAVKQLGQESIPAIVIEATDAEMGLLSLVENLSRDQYAASELLAAT